MSLRLTKFQTCLGLLMLVFCIVVSSATAQPMLADHYDAVVATAWFELQLELVRDTLGFTPPVASRAFGYTGVTLYEAIVPGMPNYQSLAGQLNELTKLPQPSEGVTYHWPTVANSALETITRYLFASTSDENQDSIDALGERFASEFSAELDPNVFQRSVTQGRVVADAIYIWSLTDGGHEGYLTNFRDDYTPPTGPGLWLPTPRSGGDPLAALQPYWGNNRPFVLKIGEGCTPPPPPEYSENPQSPFFTEAREVYDTVRSLTPEQREIALFWSDDPGQTVTPPGHSISILTQIVQQEGLSLGRAAEAYAKVGMATTDAFIGCWNAKYHYNLIRPISYIQQVIDPDWNSSTITDPVTTPPFPEYPSGHSMQSGAVAQVLTDLFGDNYAFTDHTHDAHGYEPRSFDSFFDFADEAAISRLYGGIHYRSAIEQGLADGMCIGTKINQLRFNI